MKKIYLTSLLLIFFFFFSARAQYTAIDFTLNDCDGNSVNLYSLLDKGKVVILFYEHQCSSCVAGANNLKNVINNNYAGDTNIVILYLDNGGYSCTSVKNWVNSKGFINGPCFTYSNDFSSPYGSGMPVVVVTSGADRKIYLLAKTPTQASTTALQTAIHDAFSGLATLQNTEKQIIDFKYWKSDHLLNLHIFSTYDEKAMIYLYSATGELLFCNKNMIFQKGNNAIFLKKPETSGLFILFIRIKNEEYTFKMIL